VSERKSFDLGDYVEVKDRIKLFYELYAQGRLVTGEVRVSNEPDGVPRVYVQAFAYRTPDDPLPGVGWSWMELPGKSSYTKGSELENTETSAWGRAIGSLGILIDRSIASANEVQNKSQTMAELHADEVKRYTEEELKRYAVPAHDRDGLIGKAEIAKDFPDFLPKPEPETGHVLAFKLTSEAGGIKVIAKGDLAQQLPFLRDEIIGQRVTCWGRVRDETFTKPATASRKAFTTTYQVLDLERIKTSETLLPAPEPPDDVPLVGESPYGEDDALALALYPDDIGAK
jgi:hypothetical protein